ncbi:hypothetical protein FG386_001338 [Cryptosporidium ryanae]|uniref:uncharacterized protein n=1 Tax=Cryptosporidium ryanae TaxID=515981 RepID=UPI00351A54C3|nr:hypothetical protein FG386_001338 [Cryptosporidium ryanae]
MTEYRRNYAKQELIYDLLFGDNQRNKGLRGISSNILENANKCFICNENNDLCDFTRRDGMRENVISNSSILLCIDCKRRLFSFEGFKYQCNQIKKMILNLEKTSVVLSDQVNKLNNTINRVGYGTRKKVGGELKDKNNYENIPPDWCNRDIPPKYGKGTSIIKVHDAISKINEEINNNKENQLITQLGCFHDDLVDLQETIITFINVLNTYMDTPFISLIKNKSNTDYYNNSEHLDRYNDAIELPAEQRTQPSINISLVDSEPKFGNGDNKPTNSNMNTTTAQKIEKIRKQQEKVRQQIKSLYDNNLSKSPSNTNNLIGNYFLFEKDEMSPVKSNNININYDSCDEAIKDNQGSYIKSGSKSAHINSYDVLWSPSSISSSSPLSTSSPPISKLESEEHPNLNKSSSNQVSKNNEEKQKQ